MKSRYQKSIEALAPLVEPIFSGDLAQFHRILGERSNWPASVLAAALASVAASVPVVVSPDVEEHLEQVWKSLIVSGARWPARLSIAKWFLVLRDIRPGFPEMAILHPLAWLLQTRPPGRLRTHVIGRLLDWGHSPQEKADQGWGLLEMASAQSDATVARLLIWAGAPTDARAVAVATSAELVDILLDAGATTGTPLSSSSPRLDGSPAVVWLSAREETSPALRRVLQRAGNTALGAATHHVEGHARTDHSEWAMSPWAMAIRVRNKAAVEVLMEAEVPRIGVQDGAGNSLCHLLFRPFPMVDSSLDAAKEAWAWLEPVFSGYPSSVWCVRNAAGEDWGEHALRSIEVSSPQNRLGLEWLAARLAAAVV